MEDATLNVILSRFDRLDEKFDNHVKEISNIASRVTAVETKLEPIVEDSKFKSRVAIFTHALTGSHRSGSGAGGSDHLASAYCSAINPRQVAIS